MESNIKIKYMTKGEKTLTAQIIYFIFTKICLLAILFFLIYLAYKLVRLVLLMFSGKFQKGPVKEIKLSKEQYELIKREMVIENKKYNEIMNDIIAFYFKNH